MKEHKPPAKVVVPKAAPRTKTQKKLLRSMLFIRNCFHIKYTGGDGGASSVRLSVTFPEDTQERYLNFRRASIEKLVRIKLVEHDDENSDWRAQYYKLTEAGRTEAEGYGDLDNEILTKLAKPPKVG